jgi:hypothetical protein
VGTEIVFLLGLVSFVAAMVGIDHASPGAARMGPLVAFAVAPSVFWLGYFYLQDRNEPEPKRLVGGVFLLGAFLAAPRLRGSRDARRRQRRRRVARARVGRRVRVGRVLRRVAAHEAAARRVAVSARRGRRDAMTTPGRACVLPP